MPVRLDTPSALHYGRLRIIYDLLRDQRVVPEAQANRDTEGDRG
jgi:hypothetical protein